MTKAYDAVIIGAGHNGLTCAYYLARAGWRVRIVERRSVVGGAAVTEEFHPGFRNSVASYTVSLLQPRIIADMGLEKHGYRVLERPISNFLPLPDGNYLKLGGGIERTQAEFAKFSDRDAQALPAYYAALERVAGQLRRLALVTPPNAGGGWRAIVDAAQQAWPLRGLHLEHQRDMADLFLKSASDFLGRWFESEPVQAAFGFDAVVGNYASPETPGSAYVLLHHIFGEVNGKQGAWGHVVGGMGTITQAMATACRAIGVDISVETPVERVLVDTKGVAGVRLIGGEEIAARTVVANVGPKLLFERLMSPADLPPPFLSRIRQFRTGSGTFRMNVALSALPRFAALPEPGEHHQAGIVIAPSLRYMDRAFIDAKLHGWSRAPIVEMLIPSTVDDTLAPQGCHVASLFCQQFAPDHDWTPQAERAAADTIIDTIDAHAPGFRKLVVGQQILSPRGLEEKFGLVGGDIMHGRMTLDQLWTMRPLLGHADYRGPVRGLYMCGAGTHPGGGVTGAPGFNAARTILRG
jgi:phytoene dehydrogenase-like protein